MIHILAPTPEFFASRCLQLILIDSKITCPCAFMADLDSKVSNISMKTLHSSFIASRILLHRNSISSSFSNSSSDPFSPAVSSYHGPPEFTWSDVFLTKRSNLVETVVDDIIEHSLNFHSHFQEVLDLHQGICGQRTSGPVRVRRGCRSATGKSNVRVFGHWMKLTDFAKEAGIGWWKRRSWRWVIVTLGLGLGEMRLENRGNMCYR